ncbi:hypothetical protein V1477_011351 [Vespula maculifrons]|uniref:Uncharacterized protein n=1 Tax=Vespula maculifrons TaxID=7453 RepID=A0ABD2C4K0_VESMC
MHELGKREHVLRNILLQHSRAESNRRSLDTSSVCGNRTLPDEICFGVRGGQQNELPVSRPDNLGCAVARMELSIKADGVPLEHPLSVRLVDRYIRAPDTVHDIRTIHGIHPIVFLFMDGATRSASIFLLQRTIVSDREIDEVPLLWANDLTKSRICGLENELSAGASSN